MLWRNGPAARQRQALQDGHVRGRNLPAREKLEQIWRWGGLIIALSSALAVLYIAVYIAAGSPWTAMVRSGVLGLVQLGLGTTMRRPNIRLKAQAWLAEKGGATAAAA